MRDKPASEVVRDRIIFGLGCFITLGSLAVSLTLGSNYFMVVSYIGAIFLLLYEPSGYDPFEDYKVVINNQDKES